MSKRSAAYAAEAPTKRSRPSVPDNQSLQHSQPAPANSIIYTVTHLNDASTAWKCQGGAELKTLGTYNDVNTANERARSYAAEKILRKADYEKIEDRRRQPWDAMTRSLEAGQTTERYDLDGTLQLCFQDCHIGKDLLIVSKQVVEGSTTAAAPAPKPLHLGQNASVPRQAASSSSTLKPAHLYLVLNRQRYAYGDDTTQVKGSYTSLLEANAAAERLFEEAYGWMEGQFDGNDPRDGTPRNVDEEDLWPLTGDTNAKLRFRTSGGAMRFCMEDGEGEPVDWYSVQKQKLN